MSARAFLDTNIFVYTFDNGAGRKQLIARSLVEQALRSGNAAISFQVVQEFVNVATRKFAVPLRAEDCLSYMDRVLGPLCEVHSSISLYREALDIQRRWGFSFFDSLIVAGALAASCTELFSEDLQHGQSVRELTILDPFLPG